MVLFRAALSVFISFVVTFLIPVSALSEPKTLSNLHNSPENKARPTIGLVLGGGGAKGAAHVGVLQFLEQNRIPVDIAVGTSAGSAVAALYAMGTSANDIKTTFLSTDWEKGYVDNTPRPDLSIRRKQDQRQFAMDLDLGYGNGRFLIPKGIIQGQRLQILLNEMTMAAAMIEDFDQLPLRYRAIATDLETGKEVVLSKGNLATAIRASMAVPGIFTPVEIDNKMLIDGGLANNLPINVARSLGADIIIAVDLSSPLRKSEEIDTSLEVLSQLSDYMTGNNTAEQLATLNDIDIYIKPEFGDIGSASFDRVNDTIQLGQASAQKQANTLKQFSLSQAEYDTYQLHRQSFLATKPIINQIKLINQSKLNDRIILARIHQKTGHAFNPHQLEEDLGLIYGLGYFESVTYLLETDSVGNSVGNNVLVINAKQKSWGPNLFRFGIEMEDNFNGNSEYGLSSSLLTTGINRFGAEWVNTIKIGSSPSFFSEFYQPLDYDADYFSRSYTLLERFEANAFTEGVSTATYQVRERQLGIEFGRHFGTHADLAFGLFTGGGKADIIVGPPNSPDIIFDSGAYYLRANYDRLDDQFFPSKGLYFQTQYARNRREIGADQNSDRLSYQGVLATQIGQWMAHLGFKGSILTDKTGGIEDDFRLGGLFNLSGFSSGELSDDEGMFSYIKILHQMSESFEWYIGSTLEAGDVYDKDDSVNPGNFETAGSLFVAANTFLGPIIFAYGYANKEDQAFYLSIGNTF